MQKLIANIVLLCGKIFVTLALLAWAIPIGLVFGFFWLTRYVGDFVVHVWDWAKEHE